MQTTTQQTTNEAEASQTKPKQNFTKNNDRKPRRDQPRPQTRKNPPIPEDRKRCMQAYKTYFTPFLKACSQHFVSNFPNNPNYNKLNIANIADIINAPAGEYVLPGPVEIKYTVHLALRHNFRGIPNSINSYFVNVELIALTTPDNHVEQTEEQNPQ